MIKEVFCVALRTFRSWVETPRCIVVFLVLAVILWNHLQPVSAFVEYAGYRTLPAYFPFLANDPLTQLLFMIGLVFLLADAPFMGESEVYVVQRIGRISWVIGKMFYVALATLVYFLVLFLLSMLLVAPWSSFAVEGWGKVISTLVETTASSDINLSFSIDPAITTSYSPFWACATSLLMEWLGGMVIALVMMFINLATKSRYGIAVAIFLVFLDLLVLNTMSIAFNIISPASHARLSTSSVSGASGHLPALANEILFDAVCVGVFCVLIAVTMKHSDINMRQQI